jgi:hypothetical protein
MEPSIADAPRPPQAALRVGDKVMVLCPPLGQQLEVEARRARMHEKTGIILEFFGGTHQMCTVEVREGNGRRVDVKLNKRHCILWPFGDDVTLRFGDQVRITGPDDYDARRGMPLNGKFGQVVEIYQKQGYAVCDVTLTQSVHDPSAGRQTFSVCVETEYCRKITLHTIDE